MTRLLLHEQLIVELQGEYLEDALIDNLTPEEAYRSLKNLTNQDFGYNAEAWLKWFEGKDIKTAYQGLTNGSKKK